MHICRNIEQRPSRRALEERNLNRHPETPQEFDKFEGMYQPLGLPLFYATAMMKHRMTLEEVGEGEYDQHGDK